MWILLLMLKLIDVNVDVVVDDGVSVVDIVVVVVIVGCHLKNATKSCGQKGKARV